MDLRFSDWTGGADDAHLVDGGRRMLGGVQYRMLGPLAASVDGRLVSLGGPKQRLVLAVLLVEGGEAVSLDRLIDGVWGVDPPERAKHTLQAYVSELRQLLDDPIEWAGHGYRLSLEPDQLDAARFEGLLEKGRSMFEETPARAGELLREALGLWRGRPLEDLDSPVLDPEIRRLEELRLVALELRIEADLRLGRHTELLGGLESLTAEFPLRERFRAHLMLALYRAGRQAEALRAYSRLRRTLAEELGIDPSPELQRLEDQILAQDPRLDLMGEGQLTFLFTDLEGSTELWEAHPEEMGEAVSEHDRVVSGSIASAGGSIVKTTGDGVIASLPSVDAAVEAVAGIHRGLAGRRFGPVGELRMRAAIDIGAAQHRGGDYFGPALNRCARILGLANGGQVLLSTSAAQELSVGEDIGMVDLGECRIKGVGRPQGVFQLIAPGLGREFPPLRVDGSTPMLVRSGFETTTVRGYELRERIGEGDFGAVYRAYQTSVGREVAIKAIRSEYANQASFISRFEAEAQFVAQLEHPHIVPLYDYWRDPDGAYLVMPYLRGGSLADALRRGPWNTGPVLHLLDQVGAALSYGHRRGVVHRDLKPANVLLDEEGNAFLSDFGIAVRLPDETGQPLASAPAYVPPEELRGENPTSVADVFGLGVLTFELLAGTYPPGRGAITRLAEIRPDLPSELVEVLKTATHDEPSTRYDRVEHFLRALRRAVGADVVGAALKEQAVQPSSAPVRNPYKGLRAFLETDAADFHGRDGLKDELLEAVRRNRLMAVVGPSGSGKSSVVRAGLVPALRAGALPGSRQWLITDMFPGSYPFEELEAALRRVAVDDPGSLVEELRSDERGLLRVIKGILPGDDTELVLVIDQFEELFSMVEDEETRRRFLDALTALVTDDRSRVRVITTLRADFFDRPLDYSGFGGLMREGLVAVAPLDDEALALAISRPARGVGLDLEPGLVREITSDVGDEPGSLPLLQYALTEMFSRRKGLTLTVDGYRESGGVAGALATRAEELYQGLSEAGKEAAHQIFMRLVSVDEETDDTRRRVRQSELRSLDIDQSTLDTVIQQYAAYRLLTFDRDTITRSPTVEVAHEALIRQWSRLRGWVDQQRENLALHRRFTATLNEWEHSNRDTNFLLSGGRLQQYETWAEETTLVLTADERSFLEQGRTEENRRRRRRSVVRWTAVAALAILAGAALWQWQVAEAEARQVTIRQLAASSTVALDEDPEQAILLALEAAEISRRAGEPIRPEAIAALQQAVQTSRLEMRFEDDIGVAFAPDGTAVTTEQLAAPPGAVIVDVDFSPDGRLLAGRLWWPEGDEPDQITVWDRGTGSEITRFPPPTAVSPGDWIRDMSWSPDGGLIASTTWNEVSKVTVWEMASGEEVLSVPVPQEVIPTFVGPQILAVPDPGRERVVFHDVVTGDEIDDLETPDFAPEYLDFDPIRNWLVMGSFTSIPIQTWDLRSKELQWSRDIPTSQVPVVHAGTGVVALTGVDGAVRLLDLDNEGSELDVLLGHTAETQWFQARFSPNGGMLASRTVRETLVWDMTPSGPQALGTVALGSGFPFLLTQWLEGSEVAVLYLGGVQSYDLTTGEAASRGLVSDMIHWEWPAPLSPDWELVAALDDEGRGWVHEYATGAVVMELPPCTIPMAFNLDGTALVLDGVRLCPGDATSPDTNLRSRVIAVPSGEEVLNLGEDQVWGTSGAAFNPAGLFEAGRYLAVGRQHRVDIYDMSDHRLVTTLHTLDDWQEGVLSVAFDPSGRHLAVGGGGLRGWVVDMEPIAEGASAAEALVFDRAVDPGGLPQVAINPNGVLATSGFGSLRLWDIHSGEQLIQIPVSSNEPVHAVFTYDGDQLLYVDRTDTGYVLRRFLLDPAELVALAQSRVTRGFTTEECDHYQLDC